MFSFGLGKTSLSTTKPASSVPSLADIVAEKLGTTPAPLPEDLGTPNMSTKKRGRKPKPKEPETEMDEVELDEEEQQNSKKRKRAPAKRTAKAKKEQSDEGSDIENENEDSEEQEEEPAPKRQKRTASKKAQAKTASAKKAAAKEKADSDEKENTDEKAKAAAPTASTSNKIHNSADFSVPPVQPNEIKIVSWNVAGFASILKKGFKEYMENEKPDIICLQEVKMADASWCPEGYKKYWNCCKLNAGLHGTGVFTKIEPLNVTYGIGIPEHDNEGRVITLEFEDFFLVNAYVPNAGEKLKNLAYRQRWDTDFHKYLKDLDNKKPMILCGDLNVAHQEIDLKNPKTNKKTPGFTQEERDGFTKLLSLGFVDTFRHIHGSETDCYTFWSYRGNNNRGNDVGWRLDYFVVPPRFVDRITQIYRRKHVIGSDHCPLLIHLTTKDV